MTIRKTLVASLALGAASLVAGSGTAQETDPVVHAGRASVYRQLDPGSLEKVSTPERIRAVTAGNTAPTEIWRTLEHGEKVECLDCIPHVSKLMYDTHPKTREIAAWWLRRRVFGVFGPGEVYEQTVNTLMDSGKTETQRAFAAEALGEFLSAGGVKYVSDAIRKDPSPMVRKAAVKALQRLNSSGVNGELAVAIADEDSEVRLAAVEASMRINVFTDVDALAARIDDDSADVRKRAVEALGSMRAGDAVVGLINRVDANNESDARVRKAAVAALGRIADSGARSAVEAALNDSNKHVRDAARIALRRL